jgi:hypothetical protein
MGLLDEFGDQLANLLVPWDRGKYASMPMSIRPRMPFIVVVKAFSIVSFRLSSPYMIARLVVLSPSIKGEFGKNHP